MNFPFGTNGKFIILGVPILKHFRVGYIKLDAVPFAPLNPILADLYLSVLCLAKIKLPPCISFFYSPSASYNLETK